MKAVTIVTAGCIARSRNGDALIRRLRNPGKLADNPTVREVVVQYDSIAFPLKFADTAKALPEGACGDRSQD
jgi:hypothetical protein